MPGVVVDGRDVDVMANGTLKDNSSVNRSPNSQLGSHSPQNAASNVPEAAGIDTSIEQLYDNVCEMESSGDDSPSRLSFGSDGEESRIDSELRHLVGGEATEIEIMEEESDREQEVNESDFHNGEAGSNNGKQGKPDRSHSSGSKSVSSGQSKKTPHLPVGSDGSVKMSPKTKGSNAGISVDQEAGESTRKTSPGLIYLKRHTNFTLGRASKPLIRNGNPSELGLDNPDMGPYLLKQARDLVSSGDNLQKALDFAVRAAKSFEKCSEGKPSLDLVMSLHMAAAIHCSLGQYDLAILILERSIEIPIAEEGPEHALAKFSGYMQLGDTYAMVGQLENSIRCYTMGLEVQRQALGEADLRVGETCRYLAEAHVQAIQFDEAQLICQMALDIHKENCATGSVEEAADRRLMGLICDMKGDFEAALEHLVLAGMAMSSNGQENEVALVDCSIGDSYLSLSRYDEAVFAYQKALSAFKASKGENHPSVASVFVRLADLYKKTGKLRESKEYCENAFRIYSKPAPGTSKEEIAGGYTDISAIYESLDEPEQALGLLQKALEIYDDAPGQQSTIAGIEAQMGVMYYMLGNYSDSYISFKNAITKLRVSGDRKSGYFGIALNQMGLVCVQRYAINEAADLFEEARNVLEQEYGPYHPDTLGVYSNLAGTYDAMGRLDDAIEILEYVVRIREEKLGTAHPDVDDEKRRLAELLKEAGRARNRKAKSLETLLDPKNTTAPIVN